MRTSLVWAVALSVAVTAGACRTAEDKETDDTDTDEVVDTVVDPDSDSDSQPDTDTDDTEVVDTDTDDTEVVDTDTDDTEVVDTDTDDTEVVDSDTDDTGDTLVVDTDTDETGDTLVDETGDTLVVDTDETADTTDTADTDETDDTLVIDTELPGETADTEFIDTFDDTFFLRPTADTYDTDNVIATADTFWDDDSGVSGNLAFRGTVRDFDVISGPVDNATVALRVSQAPLQITQTDVSGRFLFRPPVSSLGELTLLKTGYFNTSYFPRFNNTDLDLGLYMLTNAQVTALAGAASVTPQGNAGHAVMVAVDATGALLDGASFNVVSPSGQTPVYFDASMAVTAGTATAPDGAAIVFNLPSGTFTARATHPSLSCAALVAWPGAVAREGIVRIYPSQISAAVYRCQ